MVHIINSTLVLKFNEQITKVDF